MLESARTAGGEAPLDMALIQRAPGVPTGVVDVILGRDGRPLYEIAMPAAWDAIELTVEAQAASAAAQAICFGTLAQRAEPSRSTVRALVEGTPRQCLRVLDVNVRAPFFSEEVLRWSMEHATAAKISDEELDTVSRASHGPGCPGEFEGAATSGAVEMCGRALLEKYPNLRVLAITMGSHGSLLLTREEVDYHKGFAVAVQDTVGAGDAFTAGFVHAWLSGGSLQASNEVGNLCGSFVASEKGAMPAFPPALLQRVAERLEQFS